MSQPIPRGATDRACVLFSDLVEGRWEKVDEEFDASLRGQVDFARAWAGMADSAGSFERIDAPSARQFGGYTLVDVPLAFAAGGAIGEVVFDGADKVAGLALEFPYPRPRQPDQRRRQWEQGKRRGGFIVRNPEIEGLMRHSALARSRRSGGGWRVGVHAVAGWRGAGTWARHRRLLITHGNCLTVSVSRGNVPLCADPRGETRQ